MNNNTNCRYMLKYIKSGVFMFRMKLLFALMFLVIVGLSSRAANLVAQNCPSGVQFEVKEPKNVVRSPTGPFVLKNVTYKFSYKADLEVVMNGMASMQYGFKEEYINATNDPLVRNIPNNKILNGKTNLHKLEYGVLHTVRLDVGDIYQFRAKHTVTPRKCDGELQRTSNYDFLVRSIEEFE